MAAPSSPVQATYTPIANTKASQLKSRLFSERRLAGLAAISIPIFARLSLASTLFSPFVAGAVVLSGASFYLYNRRITEAYEKTMEETINLDGSYQDWIKNPTTVTSIADAMRILANRPYLLDLIQKSKQNVELLNRPIQIEGQERTTTLFSVALSSGDPEDIILLLKAGVNISLNDMQRIKWFFNLPIFHLVIQYANLADWSDKAKAELIGSVTEKETMAIVLNKLFPQSGNNISRCAGEGLSLLAKHHHPRSTEKLAEVVQLLVEEFNANPKEALDNVQNEVLKGYLREKETNYNPQRQIDPISESLTSRLSDRIKSSYPLTLKVAIITTIAIFAITLVGSFIPGSFFTPPLNYFSRLHLHTKMMIAFIINSMIVQNFIYPWHYNEGLVRQFLESNPQVGCSAVLVYKILSNRWAAEKLLALAEQDKHILDIPVIYEGRGKTTLLDMAEISSHTKEIYIKLLQAGAKIDPLSTIREVSNIDLILRHGDLARLGEKEKIALLAKCEDDLTRQSVLSRCFGNDATKAFFALAAHENSIYLSSGASSARTSLINFLIDQGADLTARNTWGETIKDLLTPDIELRTR